MRRCSAFDGPHFLLATSSDVELCLSLERGGSAAACASFCSACRPAVSPCSACGQAGWPGSFFRMSLQWLWLGAVAGSQPVRHPMQVLSGHCPASSAMHASFPARAGRLCVRVRPPHDGPRSCDCRPCGCMLPARCRCSRDESTKTGDQGEGQDQEQAVSGSASGGASAESEGADTQASCPVVSGRHLSFVKGGRGHA